MRSIIAAISLLIWLDIGHSQIRDLSDFNYLRVTVYGGKLTVNKANILNSTYSLSPINENLFFESLHWDSLWFTQSSSSSHFSPVQPGPMSWPYSQYDSSYTGISGSVDMGSRSGHVHIRHFHYEEVKDTFGYPVSDDNHPEDYDLRNLKIISDDSTYLLLGSDSAASLDYTASEGSFTFHEKQCDCSSRSVDTSIYPISIRIHFSVDRSGGDLGMAPSRIQRDGIRVFPNPASSNIQFNVPDGIIFYNDRGEETTVSWRRTGEQTIIASVSNLVPGVYFYRVKSPASQFTAGSFVVAH